MTARRLREIADKVEKLCVEGSRGKRNVACPLCRAMAVELREHPEEIVYGRRTLVQSGCEEVQELVEEVRT